MEQRPQRELLLVTDLTLMRGGRVCLAGLNPQLELIRLVVEEHLERKHLNLYDADPVRPRGVYNVYMSPVPEREPPHLEDHYWCLEHPSQFLRITSDDKLLNVLQCTAADSVADIFGTPLHRNSNFKAGNGHLSIGTVKPRAIHRIEQRKHRDWEREFQYRLEFTDPSGEWFNIPINDLSFLASVTKFEGRQYNHEEVLRRMVKKWQNRDVWLRIGATRPWNGWCWLQVTAIFTFPYYLEGKTYTDFGW